MPRFAPNFTTKWKIGYINGGATHHLTLNLGTGDTAPSTTHRFQATALFNALSAVLFNDLRFVSSEVRPAGTNFFVPTTMPTQPTGGALDPTDPTERAEIEGQLSFVGSAGAAGRAAVYIHGVYVSSLRAAAGQEWRVPSDVPVIGAALAALAAGGFRTAGDGAPGWKQYANLKYNDYHLSRSR